MVLPYSLPLVPQGFLAAVTQAAAGPEMRRLLFQ